MAWPPAASAGLVLALLAAAFVPPASPARADTGGLREVAFLTADRAHSPTPWQAFDGSNIVVFDVNGDGKPELLLNNDNLRHYVLDPRQGIVLAELHTAYPGGDLYGGRDLSSPSVGRLTPGGPLSVVILDGASYLSRWDFDNASSTSTHFAFDKKWETYLWAYTWDPNFNDTHPWAIHNVPDSEGNALLADTTGSGTLEIFGQTDDISMRASFTPDGKLRWFSDPAQGSDGGPVLGDLNGDGHKEVVWGGDSGVVYVYDPNSGAILWQYDSRDNWTEPGTISYDPTVADLFGDGHEEICYGTRQVVQDGSPDWVDRSHAKLECVDGHGNLLWRKQYDWGNPHVEMRPVPFDVNGDGVKDLVWTDWNSVGHNPGNYELTNRLPNMFALNGKDGSLLWRVTLDSVWSNKDLALADVLGTGSQQLLAETLDPVSGADGLGVFDPHNGHQLAFVPFESGWVATRGPVVADLQGDGYMDVVVPLVRNATTNFCPEARTDLNCREGALEIFATGQPLSTAFANTFTWNAALDHPYALKTEHPKGPPVAWPAALVGGGSFGLLSGPALVALPLVALGLLLGAFLVRSRRGGRGESG